MSVCENHSPLRVDSWVDSGHGDGAKSTVPVKLKLFLFMSCRYVLGSRGIAPLIHDLSTRWKWVVRFMPQLLYPLGKNPSTHWIGGWVDANAGLDILPLPAFRPWNVWAIVEPLYRLCYLRSSTLPICYRIWKEVWFVKKFCRPYTLCFNTYSIYFSYWAAALYPLLSQLSANG